MLLFVIILLVLFGSFHRPWGGYMYSRPYYRRRPMDMGPYHNVGYGPMNRGPMRHEHRGPRPMGHGPMHSGRH